MRNIKFRAKAITDNKWRYGYITECDDFCIIDQNNECYVDENYDFRGDTHFFRISGAMCDKNTIGQFTGLKDWKEKEIYEGDIISTFLFDDKLYYKVEWDEIRSSWIFKSLQSSYGGYCYAQDIDIQSSEVIGNIYENKELLKQ